METSTELDPASSTGVKRSLEEALSTTNNSSINSNSSSGAITTSSDSSLANLNEGDEEEEDNVRSEDIVVCFSGGSDQEDEYWAGGGPHKREDIVWSTSSAAKRRRKSSSKDEEKAFKCTEPECFKSYASKGGLRQHIRAKHEAAVQAAIQRVELQTTERIAFQTLLRTDPQRLVDLACEMRAKLDKYENVLPEPPVDQDHVKRIIKTLADHIRESMVYTNSGLRDHPEPLKVKVGDVTEALLVALVGRERVGHGAERFSSAEGQSLLFPKVKFGRGLRYGGSLGLTQPIALSWSRSTQILTATSAYGIVPY